MTDIVAQDEPRNVERLMDRYWFLLRGGGLGAEDGAGRTQVVRDGEFVVVSVEAKALGWPEGTLLFRFRSETAPCVACVDRAAAIARHRTHGSLTSSDVREMLRFAVARCAAAGIDAAHDPAPDARDGVEAAAPVSRRTARDRAGGGRRYDAELWLIL
ncbi:hypothetical protein SOCE26_024130 [Sorangium cellulosum]|uniref:Uncharacterized protein n=1 Tax=Sorangium cellulosum TaxID=56 RepID=A0A2L0ENY7_SORCE|nr:hypothetical protein [Sorangium cellulosum]AUX41009.1 hypothetical protein SOCE26_024130 [Sorangium cellulosum]